MKTYPITELDANQQAELLVDCPRFMLDITGPDDEPQTTTEYDDTPTRPPLLSILIVIGAVLLAVLMAWLDPASGAEPHARPQATRLDGGTLEALWRAICVVESNNNPEAIGDAGRAVGIAQIWPIMVADVNHILGRKVFTLDDRRSPARSRLMFDTYMRHYAAGKTVEWAARAWCCGPGWERRATAVTGSKGYWEKVRKVMLGS